MTRTPQQVLVVFLLCVAGDLLASILTDHLVMTDEVYMGILGVDSTTPGVDRMLDTIRGWSQVLLVLTPFVLLARVGGAALLVQLILMGLGSRRRLLPIFGASLSAQLVLVLGRLARGARLLATAQHTRTTAALTEPMFTVASVLALPLGWTSLPEWIGRISLLPIAWCIVLAVALRADAHLGTRVRVGSVVATAAIIGMVRWIGWLYLTRLGAPYIGP